MLTAGGLRRAQLVGHIMDGIDHRGVVTLYGQIKFSRTATQLRTQSPTIEQRQAQSRPPSPLLATGAKQTIQPNARHAHKCQQVDVGVKLVARCGHIADGSFDPPARGCDVGPAS